MKILILGKKGQLAKELSNSLKKKFKIFLVAKSKNKSFDLNHHKSYKRYLNKKIDTCFPQIIINATGFTDVDNAETKKKECWNINAYFLKYLSEICKKKKISLIHFSTDYIFDGKKKKSYSEKSIYNPINYYGETKAVGEKYIINSKCNYLIFRISWLYNFKDKKNFFYKIIKKIIKQKTLYVVNDQIGSPTSTKFVVKYINKFIERIKLNNIKYGVYNLCPRQPVSRYKIAKYINSKINFKKNLRRIIPVNSKFFMTKANRPEKVILNIHKIENYLKLKLPNWKDDINFLIKKWN